MAAKISVVVTLSEEVGPGKLDVLRNIIAVKAGCDGVVDYEKREIRLYPPKEVSVPDFGDFAERVYTHLLMWEMEVRKDPLA